MSLRAFGVRRVMSRVSSLFFISLLSFLISTLSGCISTQAEHGDAATARAQTDQEGSGIDYALYRASCEGHTDMAQLFLERGASANGERNPMVKMAYSPLQCAAKEGHVSTVALLLQHGADRTRKDMSGKTALDLARKNGHTEVVKILEDGSATPAAAPQNPPPSAAPPVY